MKMIIASAIDILGSSVNLGPPVTESGTSRQIEYHYTILALFLTRPVLTRTHFNQSLRGAPAHPELAEGRGNLDEVVNTSANRLCYFDEIAALRSQ
jgi:hypothetical protein